ncbi:alpha/beta hydrolase family protein [Micromonospora sp. DT53]|uniref:alpha/beta hydrolase family protein n=1 Tax=Micromonospora sp. DT53 TaxID=3393444 RepID=UPI003CEC11D1
MTRAGQASRRSAFAVPLLLVVLLAACLAAPAWAADGPGGNGLPRAGDLIGTPTALHNVPPEISAVADGELIGYRMPGIRGGQVDATAMLFVPTGAPPPGGWPLLVWGHGTVGWAPECAPSVQLEQRGVWADGPNAALFAAVLGMGIAIVAPDYEGLGYPDRGVVEGHGYYHLSSEGQSMIYAAVAAQRYLGARLSGQWVPAGWSEGGFAALAAASYVEEASQVDPALDYRGTITLAPVPDVPAMNQVLWREIRAASGSGREPTEHQIDQLVFANAETIYFTRTQRLAGYDVDPGQVYGPNMLRIYRDNSRACLTDLNRLVRQDILDYLRDDPAHRLDTYPGVRGGAPNALPENQRFYAENQGRLENSTLPGSILWLYGTDDITSPAAVTYATVNKMLINGNDINLGVLEGAGHYDVPVDGLPLIEARLRQLFI